MLNKSTLRSDEQLKTDGFNADEIRQFRRAEGRYYLLQISLDDANGAKDWDAVLDLEPQIAHLEHVLLYQGKNPKEIPLVALKEIVNGQKHPDNEIDKAFKRVKNPGTGIRAFCISCMGGQPAEVRKCQAITCPLWSFRLGGNPFFGKVLPPVQKLTLEDDDNVDIEEDASEGIADAD